MAAICKDIGSGLPAKVPEVTLLCWAAFILTRPLGAVVGDFLDKPHDQGGLELSRYGASLVLLLFTGACILLFPQRPAAKPH